MSDALIVGIIAAIAGLFTPVVGWLLNRQGVSHLTRKFNALKARIEFIEKLSDSKSHFAQFNNEIDKLTAQEMSAILAETEMLSETGRAGVAVPGAEMGKWQQAILSYAQISLKGRVYKGLFYAFSLIAITGSAAALNVAKEGETVFVLIGGVFYLIIGLLFRSAAVHTYETDKKKAVTTKPDD